MRFTVYIPAILILLFIIINYIAIRFKMKGLRSEFKNTLLRKLTLYLIAFVASQMPAVINFFQNLLRPDEPIFILFLLQAIFQPAQGLFNALVYGFNEDAFLDQYSNIKDKLKLKKRVKSLFSCCKKTRGKSVIPEEEVPIFNYDYQSDDDDDASVITIR